MQYMQHAWEKLETHMQLSGKSESEKQTW